ncbi:hypothetical protein ATANTOWER_021124, partial [Ataeniobius toweri]|nr:hypothetical protein [Ataeniobius toweri]
IILTYSVVIRSIPSLMFCLSHAPRLPFIILLPGNQNPVDGLLLDTSPLSTCLQVHRGNLFQDVICYFPYHSFCRFFGRFSGSTVRTHLHSTIITHLPVHCLTLLLHLPLENITLGPIPTHMSYHNLPTSASVGMLNSLLVSSSS